MKKKWNMLSLLMTIIITGTILIAPLRTQASSGNLKKLKAGKTYKSYDITGDGKKDSIKIECGDYDGDMYKTFRIYINDKEAYKYREKEYPGFYGVQAKLITLANNKKYLFVNSWSWDDDNTICAVFRYKNGKLKKTADFMKYYSKYGYHGGADVAGVACNSIKVKFWHVNYSIGLSYYQMSFSYKGGTLKQDKTKAKLSKAWKYDRYTRKFIINKSIKAYSSPNGGKTAFRLEEGDEITIDQCRISPNKMMFRVKCGSRTGWIKALTYYPKTESAQLIKEPHYSG